MGVEVCPVHKPKSIQTSSIHVDAMLCDPQPKGLKRKYPEEDEPDSLTTKNYSQQQQEMFEISYEKLCRFRQNADSSLLRYVLIYNTMRRVEQEMERDGVKMNYLSGASFLPPGNCEMSTLDPLPNSTDAAMPSSPMGVSPGLYTAEIDPRNILPSVIHPLAAMNETNASATNCSGDYDRRAMDFSGSTSGRATPFVRTSYDRVESGALWTEESDRLTSLNWSSVFSCSSSNVTSSCPSARNTCTSGHFDTSCSDSNGCVSESVTDDVICTAETSLHTLMPPTAGTSSCMSNLSITYSSSSSTSPSSSPSSGNVSPTSGSSPTSSEDEIFGDIDLTLYDYDLLSPLSPPNVRMAPVSAEELMRSLSNSADSANPRSTSGYYKNEHFGDDHVATSVCS